MPSGGGVGVARHWGCAVTVPVMTVAVVLGVLFGAVMGMATVAVSGRVWLALLVACVWAAAVTFVLGVPW